jgi:hypothetical protein
MSESGRGGARRHQVLAGLHTRDVQARATKPRPEERDP